MGRTSALSPVLVWIKKASKDNSLQRRKFYSAKEMHHIYLAQTNEIDNNDKTTKVNRYQMRAFTALLCKIVKNNLCEELKFKYNRNDGYNFILISAQDLKSTDIDNIVVCSKIEKWVRGR